MKLHANIGFLFLAAALILASCEEVIEIDLNSSHPVLVAEGYLDRDSACRIELSYTSDYFNPDEAQPENNAIIRLTGPKGQSELLSHLGDGIYSGTLQKNQDYGEYQLEVEVDDVIHSGVTMLKPVPELLKMQLEDFFLGSPHASEDFPKMLNLSFSRPDEEANYLMLKLKLNGEALDEPFALASDEYSAGGDTMRYTTVVYPPPMVGDTLELQFYAIDEDAFRYYYQVGEAISGMSMSSTPYNPASNLGEDILGYFMARSTRDTTLYF